MTHETLGDAFPKEQQRLRELLQVYRDLGPVGTFGAVLIEDCLRRADLAAVSQDLPAMVSLYQEMRGFE